MSLKNLWNLSPIQSKPWYLYLEVYKLICQFVDFAERDETQPTPQVSAWMKKLQRLEESKRAYDERTMNPRKNSDDEEESAKPPIATKEISRSMQVKEDLRQGVQHMVKFTRLSKTDKLTNAGQKTPTNRTGATESNSLKRAS